MVYRINITVVFFYSSGFINWRNGKKSSHEQENCTVGERKTDGNYFILEKEFSIESFERQNIVPNPTYTCDKQIDEISFHEIADVQNNDVLCKENDEESFADKYENETRTSIGIQKTLVNLEYDSVSEQIDAAIYSEINELENAYPGNMNDAYLAENDKLYHNSAGDYDTMIHTKVFETTNKTDYGVIQNIAEEYDRLDTVIKPDISLAVDTEYDTFLSAEKKSIGSS